MTTELVYVVDANGQRVAVPSTSSATPPTPLALVASCTQNPFSTTTPSYVDILPLSPWPFSPVPAGALLVIVASADIHDAVDAFDFQTEGGTSLLSTPITVLGGGAFATYSATLAVPLPTGLAVVLVGQAPNGEAGDGVHLLSAWLLLP